MPWSIYSDDPCWVPPLIADQKRFLNPKTGHFFHYGDAKLFLAIRNGEVVGRISAQVNRRHDDIYNDGKGFFGFFDCVDDITVARALFDAAETYLRSSRRVCIEGPYSFSIYDEIGVQLDGFSTQPYLLTLHNKPYYASLIQQCGYDKSVDWHAFRANRETSAQQVIEKYSGLRDRVLDRGRVKLRTLDWKHFDRDAKSVQQIFAKAWDRNWGHVPISDSEFAHIAKLVKQIVIPKLSMMAEVDGAPVGFSLVVYDANVAIKKLNGKLFPLGFLKLWSSIQQTNRCRLLLMGMQQEFRGLGYELAFYVHLAEQASRLGIKEAELSLVAETNSPLLTTLAKIPALERYKSYRIFKKLL